MESDSTDISLPLTTEQKPEIAPNTKPSRGIIQMPSKDLPLEERLKLKNCGLPEKVLQSYSLKGIDTMLEWQLKCLSKPGVLTGNKNLIVSAPTSAGKSLVGEMIALKCILEKKKKVLIILPYVSGVRMTEDYLKYVFEAARVKVKGFSESSPSHGDISKADVSICTIERANILIRNYQENLSEIGLMIVDEFHMVGDNQRGYHLDILLSYILYMKDVGMLSTNIQLVGLSTSLEKDEEILTCWLKANFYSHSIRPVPLVEKVKVDNVLYNTEFQEIEKLDSSNAIKDDEEGILQVSKDTLLAEHCVLIFCQTKKECEDLALKLANALPEELEQSMKIDSAKMLVADKNLEHAIPKGVAFHHAGLSREDQKATEKGFRKKIIKIVVATTTLSASVNMPVRLVIVTSPYDYRNCLINFRTYKQMVGRAGRKGLDEEGKSILFCKENQRLEVKDWFNTGIMPISSCLLREKSTFRKSTKRFNKVLLSLVDRGIASKKKITTFYKFTLCCYQNGSDDFSDTLTESLKYLLSNKFIEESKLPSCQMSSDAEDTANCRDEKCYSVTKIGSATAWSGLSPEEALALYQQLKRNEEESPHYVYYLYLVSFHIYYEGEVDIVCLLIYVFAFQGAKVSGKEEFACKFESVIRETSKDLIQVIRTLSDNTSKYEERMPKTKVMVALALNELIDDIPIERVEEKYGIAKNRLQSLKSEAGNFAKMAASFCKKLEWEKHEVHFTELKTKCLPGERFNLEECLEMARDSESEDTSAMLSAPPQKKQKIEHQPPAANSTQKTPGNEILLKCMNFFDLIYSYFHLSDKVLSLQFI